ncbi:MAG: metal-dependent hydrolase [Clostridia bacterium]|nr:metal-dependent hydrolase [Clostridia bacterium]
MMSKTHIAVGVATAVAVTQPQSAGALLAAILGGSVGGVICDVDTRANRDALLGKVLVMAIAVIILLSDSALHAGIGSALLRALQSARCIGLAGFAVVALLCALSPHRGFSHSLLALILFDCALRYAGVPIRAGFACGFLSHVIIDLLNKKRVRVFYPFGRGLCLNLCYADGAVNAVLGICAGIASALLIAFRALPLIP